MKLTKKLIAVFVLASSMVVGAFADTLCANDVDVGDISGKKVVGSFTLIGASDKPIKVEDKTKDPKVDGSLLFTKRLNFKGVGKAGCKIQFTAKAGEKVDVWAMSSSKTDGRPVQLLNEKNKTVGSADVSKYEGDTVSKVSFTVPADGTYYVTGKGGGIYVYQVSVGK